MRVYNINHRNVASGTSIVTLAEFTAAAAKSMILLRAELTQKGSTTSAQQDVEIVRKSGAGTNVTAPTATPMDAGDSAFAGTVRGMCTTEGTIGVTLKTGAFNWVNGWIYLPVPEERIAIPGAGILGIRLPTAPPSLTFDLDLVVAEIG